MVEEEMRQFEEMERLSKLPPQPKDTTPYPGMPKDPAMIKPEVNQYWLGKDALFVVLEVDSEKEVMVQRVDRLRGDRYGPRTMVDFEKFTADAQLVDRFGKPIVDPNLPPPDRALVECDVVLLKSGGFKMTVTTPTPDYVWCLWHDVDGTVQRDSFPISSLMRVEQ